MPIKKTIAPKKITKKEINREISDKLANTLAPYKVKIGEKKFNNLLKKTSKIFAESLVKANRKTNKTVAVKKKAAKKKVKSA
jgi:hypothetical protein